MRFYYIYRCTSTHSRVRRSFIPSTQGVRSYSSFLYRDWTSLQAHQ